MPRPRFVSASHIPGAPGIILSVVFDLPMDQTVTPANGSWLLSIDGPFVPITGQSWADAFTLDLQSGASAPPLTSGTIELIVEDPNLLGIASPFPVLPFGPEVYFP